MIQIEMTNEEEEQFIRDVLDNLPEASAGMGLECTKFNYKKCEFEFEDVEEGIMHTLTMEKAKVGLRKLINAEVKGKCHVISSSQLFDPGEWDAFTVDALVQFSLIGDLVYG